MNTEDNIQDLLKYLKKLNWRDGYYTTDDLLSLSEVSQALVVESVRMGENIFACEVDAFLLDTGLPRAEFDRIVEIGVAIAVDRMLAERSEDERRVYWEAIDDAQNFYEELLDEG
jgi:hypothetical protein